MQANYKPILFLRINCDNIETIERIQRNEQIFYVERKLHHRAQFTIQIVYVLFDHEARAIDWNRRAQRET